VSLYQLLYSGSLSSLCKAYYLFNVLPVSMYRPRLKSIIFVRMEIDDMWGFVGRAICCAELVLHVHQLLSMVSLSLEASVPNLLVGSKLFESFTESLPLLERNSIYSYFDKLLDPNTSS
jgi:hypothetical protein